MAVWSAGRTALLASGFHPGQGSGGVVGSTCALSRVLRCLSSAAGPSSKARSDGLASGAVSDVRSADQPVSSANQAKLHAALQRRLAKKNEVQEEQGVRSFREFVTEAAPFLGCSTAGLADAHSVRYPPVDATSMFPHSRTFRQSHHSDLLTFEHFPDSLEFKAMDMYRRHNITMPCKEHQRIYGTVMAVTGRKAYVDAGDSTLTAFPTKGLNIEDLVSSEVPLHERRGAHDVRVGDVFVFSIESTRSPFGGMWLNPKATDRESRRALVWEEIRRAYFQNTPINGRILNPVYRGYAVGVGGFVGFLPYSFAPSHVSSRLGVLQRLYVFSIREEAGTRDFLLRDPVSWRQSRRLLERPGEFQAGRDDFRRPPRSSGSRS